jgi:hypothetical protein
VGSFKPNRFGLYDLGGNAWQWCEDWMDEGHKERVLRGSAWNGNDRDRGCLRSSRRDCRAPGFRNDTVGFRCVLSKLTTRTTATNETPSVNSLATYPASAVPPGPTNAVDGEDNMLTPEEIADGWKLLFNGKDLTGWKGSSEVWSVDHGAITMTASATGNQNDGQRNDLNLIWQGGRISSVVVPEAAKNSIDRSP